MALFIYDLYWMLLPNKLIYPTLLVAAVGRFWFILLEPNKVHSFLNWALAILIASGIFLFLFYFSKGKWIGFGDVRLGLVLGTLVGSPGLSFLLIFVASLLGTLAALPGLFSGNRNLSSRIPFGPFLILATFIVVLFGQPFLDWYSSFLI